MINIAIVDDEQYWIEKIEAEIKMYWNEKAIQIDSYQKSGDFLVSEKEYQLILMDVEMPGTDGLQIVEIYRKRYPNVLVAMVTSHMEFAPKAFKVNAFRYLCKANLAEDMREALEHAESVLVQKDTICFHVVNQEELRITCEDIIYIETDKRNVKIHTVLGDYTANERITELEVELKKYGFCSIHRSVLVNLAWVKELYKSDIILKNEEKLVVSGRRKKEIERELYQWRFERANQ